MHAASLIRKCESLERKSPVSVDRQSTFADGFWRAQGLFLCYMPRFPPSQSTSLAQSPFAKRRISFASTALESFPHPSPITTMEESHTPNLVSPDTKTPPAATKRNPANGFSMNGAERAGSEPVDPTALSKALKDMEDAGRVRERTPGASPSRKRQRVYGDRLVKV